MPLHFRSYGSGHPLIILHGVFGSLDNWATLARRWGSHFHVLTVDARNHGRSFHDPVMTYPAMVEDLARFMDEQALASAHLLGHSMGGKTAMHCALSLPQRVDRLVVVDIGPREYERGHDVILDALQKLDPGAFSARADADRALAEHIPEPAVRQFLLKNLARTAAGHFRWKMNLGAIASSYDELRAALPEAPPCDRPALFIRGSRSRFLTDDDRSRILALFPRAAMLTIDGAGHWVHAEAPDALERAVTSFLTG